MGNRVSSTGDTRTVKLGCKPSKNFPDNEIISSKYTVWNFIPKNLFEQFRRIANFYFLCTALIALSIESPITPFTSIAPLVFVVVVTAIKQGYEDYLRHRADREVNNILVTVIRNGCTQKIEAKKIKVGDLIKLDDEQDVPCDIVLLLSSIKEGKCFVTTANLDGETNLKTVLCPKSLKTVDSVDQLTKLEATIECEKPTPDLYKFYGRLEFGVKVSSMLRQSIQSNLESLTKRLTRQSSLDSDYHAHSVSSNEYQSAASDLNRFGDRNDTRFDNIRSAYHANSSSDSSGDEDGDNGLEMCCRRKCLKCGRRQNNGEEPQSSHMSDAEEDNRNVEEEKRVSKEKEPEDKKECLCNCKYFKRSHSEVDTETTNITSTNSENDISESTKETDISTKSQNTDVDDVGTAKTLKDIENSLKTLEKNIKHSVSDGHAFSKSGIALKNHSSEQNFEKFNSTTNVNTQNEVLSKTSSTPEIGQHQTDEHFSKNNSTPQMIHKKTFGPQRTDSTYRSAMKHRKTDSNVSRVSFNIDPSIIRRKSSWTFERKASLISQRKSSLLSSRKPSLATAEGGLADPLSSDNLLLRGARVKNTEYVYGCAVYTGQETKLALNSKLTSNKFSTVEKSINKFLIFFLILLLAEVAISTILKAVTESRSDYNSKHSYLGELPHINFSSVVQDFFSFFVLYNYIIPISLYVTIEMQKFLGTLFFEWDLSMYDDTTGQAAVCNTSDLNEELGQVEYLFTDKTGTLTENNMQFRRCSINGTGYFERDSQLYRLPDDGTDSVLGRPVNLSFLEKDMEHFFLSLTLCHTVQVQEEPDQEGNLRYSAASPDEKALVEAMQKLGAIYTGDDDDLIVVEMFGDEKIFRKLDILEFSSDRKRMSIIVEDEQGEIWLYCKGAESAVLSLVVDGPTQKTLDHVADFAVRGLRTLVIGYKKISKKDFEKISIEMQKARQTLSSRREAVVAEAYKKIESDLTVLGATGVEDKLQDGVQETLESLRAAGMKVWILTGDKVETAVNISMSCGHMKPGTIKLQLVGQNKPQMCSKQLLTHKETIAKEELKYYGLVVDGESLAVALKHEKDLFREVCCSCTSVICCRMSPLQKSEVVSLVKLSSNRPITAAIGDGANDVSMIQEAHVGLGIMGKEGRQAVRCSDFAFARFKFVREALLVHGHWYYLRISTLVQYFFYKNIVFITPQIYFVLLNGFSTQSLYDSLYLAFYNLLFTALPILIFGLLEQDYSAKQLRQYPQLYQMNAKNALMRWSHFAKWNLFGLWHSVAVFGIPAYFYWYNSGWLARGNDSDIATFGVLIMHCVVMVVSLKLCLHARYWSVAFIGSILISVIGFILVATGYCLIFISLLTDTSYYWSYIQLLASPNFWLLSTLIIIISLLPDVIFETVIQNWSEWKRGMKPVRRKFKREEVVESTHL